MYALLLRDDGELESTPTDKSHEFGADGIMYFRRNTGGIYYTPLVAARVVLIEKYFCPICRHLGRDVGRFFGSATSAKTKLR